MRFKTLTLAASAALASLAGTAHAAEPYTYLDRFNELKVLSADLWMESEITRLVLNKQLYFGLGTAGNMTTDAGNRVAMQFLTIANSTPITQLAADVVVDHVQADTCSTSRAIGYTRLRMGGAFFNVGGATIAATAAPMAAASMVGDVVAWVTWQRMADSVDADGAMSLVASVNQCKNTNCSSYTTLGTADLGLATRGVKDRVFIAWDQPSKTFTFQRGATGAKRPVSYTVSDSAAASNPAKRFTIQNGATNCASDTRAVSKIVTRIDNVSVNESAAPF